VVWFGAKPVHCVIKKMVSAKPIRPLLLQHGGSLLIWGCVLIALPFITSCRRTDQRPRATYIPITQIEQNFGKLITVSNVPTPDQHGTGDRLGLFEDNSGTVWGIPLTIGEGGLLGCAPPTLREAPVTDTLPVDAFEIVGASNEPSGWRGGTGKLELLLRDPQGHLRWHPVAAAELKSGPVCWSQSPPEMPLKYYRLERLIKVAPKK
jgi:hypothetical protein